MLLLQVSPLSCPLYMAFLLHFTALGRQWVGCWASTCSGWCCFIAPWHPLNQLTSQAFLRASPTPFIFLFLSFPRKKLDSRGTPGWLACLEKEFLSFPQAQMRLTGTAFQTILILGKKSLGVHQTIVNEFDSNHLLAGNME